MIKKNVFFIFLFLLTIFNSSFVFAETQSDEVITPKFNGWKQAETEHFRFIFEESSRETAEQYALIADDAWNKIGKIYAFPPEKTDIYITDRTNTVNAYTYSAPPYIGMFTSPVLEPTFTFRDDWKKLFFTHELIHHANFHFEDRKSTKMLSNIIGPFSLGFDFMNVNRWALEGLTTVLETELTDGGRGRSPYWELEYKSLTLDNAFQQYNEIGLDQRPPYGSIYVFGYLIMRSIVDNYGVQALADIERNRPLLGSWENSVRLVTGRTAQDIYADVKIALAKKYADERKISEGKIITPRTTNTSYYKPLIVYDDGTFLTLRTTPGKNAALVKFDPSAKNGMNYLEDTHPEKDLNTVFQETILLNTSFSEVDCATADLDGNVYLCIGKQYLEKNPGYEYQIPMYKWNKEEGLRPLTPKVSMFQPSVSRNGKVLVAVQQKGLQMRLVTIDTETGVYKSLLEDEKLSFIEPSVNADGTKITFLVLNGKKAAVAVADINNPQNYQIVANNDDENIVDPSYPVWNNNGNLIFTCNYRGRLEQFEIIDTANDNDSTEYEIVEQNDSLIVRPVVSDPIGVTWAYQCDKGILYTSTSSSGQVIKIKPNSEWGRVPDYYGPSMPGEKITFGSLMNDYPDFNPYIQLSEIEEPEDSNETEKTEDGEEIPTPVKGKKIKHRPTEMIEKAENTNSTITELQKEKRFIPFPQPLLYLPSFNFIYDSEGKKFYPGVGAFLIAQTPNLQQNYGYQFVDLVYYPQLNNFNAVFFSFAPVGPSDVGFLFSRYVDLNDHNIFVETTIAQIGTSIPFLNRRAYHSLIDLALVTSVTGTMYRFNPSPCSAGSQPNAISDYTLSGNLGFDFASKTALPKEKSMDITASAFAYALYDFKLSKPQIGCEGDMSFTKELSASKIGLNLKGRYYPFRKELIISSPVNIYAGEYVDNESPLAIIPQASYIIPNILSSGLDFKASAELLLKKYSNNSELNYWFDDSIGAGLELLYSYGRQYISAGIYTKFNSDDDFSDFSTDSLKLKFTLKYSFERF